MEHEVQRQNNLVIFEPVKAKLETNHDDLEQQTKQVCIDCSQGQTKNFEKSAVAVWNIYDSVKVELIIKKESEDTLAAPDNISDDATVWCKTETPIEFCDINTVETETLYKQEGSPEKSLSSNPVESQYNSSIIINGEKEFKCHVCGYLSVTKGNLKQHRVAHSCFAAFECDHCKTEQILEKRILGKHGDDKLFNSNLCSYSKSDVKHIDNHCSERSFLCGICDYRAKTKSNLSTHVKKHIGIKPFECKLCPYKSVTKINLKRHLIKHSSIKPFVCGHCGSRFKSKPELRIHIRAHTGEQPYQCDQCDYKGKTYSNLAQHARRHTGEKPFKCELCAYTSISKTRIAQHFVKHALVKPFLCDHCDFRTKSSSNLAHHISTHTGEKPFKCELCDYRSITRANLTRHFIKHTTVEPFVCGLCGFRTKTKSYLRKHAAKHSWDGEVFPTASDEGII